jgi:hypothetical protein
MLNSPIELLPPELLTNVFEALGKDCRSIQSCRLVCKVFHELSSHHLITRVVIAERFDSLRRLKWVMNHPFFSKYVTHLVWDASHFDRTLAYDLDAYKDAFMDSPGSWCTPRLEQSWRENRRLLSRLLRYDPREKVSPLPGDEFLENDDDSDISEMDEYEHGRNLVGFPEYHRRYDIQRTIRERELTSRYLRFAVAKLPQLRHIDYTDFRALSLQGESFQDLCQRLFGESLHPKLLCLTSESTSRMNRDGVAQSEGVLSLVTFIRQLDSLEWQPQSFSIGRNNFDLPELDISGLYEYGKTPNSSSLTLTPLRQNEIPHWLASIKSLRIPVIPLKHLKTVAPPHVEGSSYTDLLACTTASLQDLSLLTDSYARSPQASLRDVPSALQEILSPLKFEKLRSLELHGWRFTLEELGAFLFAHAETLRYIHLIGCECYGGAYATALQKIKRDWTIRLNLRGAEVIGLRFPKAPYTHDWAQEMPCKHKCDKNVKGMPESNEFSLPDQDQHPISMCPGPRPIFETAMLGGRYNHVVRRSPRQRLPYDPWKQWEEIPVNPYG